MSRKKIYRFARTKGLAGALAAGQFFSPLELVRSLSAITPAAYSQLHPQHICNYVRSIFAITSAAYSQNRSRGPARSLFALSYLVTASPVQATY